MLRFTSRSTRDIADAIFDYLDDEDFQETTWGELYETTVDLSEDREYPWGILDACGLEENTPDSHVITRADLIRATDRLGFAWGEHELARDCKIHAAVWLHQAETYRSLIGQCGEAPEFAQAKQEYARKMEIATRNYESCCNGVLIRVEL